MDGREGGFGQPGVNDQAMIMNALADQGFVSSPGHWPGASMDTSEHS